MKKNEKKGFDVFKLLFGIDRTKSKVGKAIDAIFLILMLSLSAYLWFIERPNVLLQNEFARMRLKEFEKMENIKNWDFGFTENTTPSNASNTTCPPCTCLPSESGVIE